MSQIGRLAQFSVDSIAALICPPECAWCAKPLTASELICADCESILVSSYYRCQKCAAPISSVLPDDDCVRCRSMSWKFETVYTLGPYRGELRKAVIQIKKRSAEPLRKALGQLLAHQILADHVPSSPASPELTSKELVDWRCKELGRRRTETKSPMILPVPNHWKRRFTRSADTAGSLAHALADATHWPVNTGIIRRIRKTSKQGMLAWSERVGNVRGAFEIAAAKSLSGGHVIVVDDVFTSGATSAEVSRVLRKAGASRVDVAVVARGTGARESKMDLGVDEGSDSADQIRPASDAAEE